MLKRFEIHLFSNFSQYSCFKTFIYTAKSMDIERNDSKAVLMKVANGTKLVLSEPASSSERAMFQVKKA